jgi:uncharacterized protein YndB with AHSA1/START domain
VSSSVLVAIRVKAAPERAFDAFTAEIGQWWVHNPEFRFTPREPGVLSFEPGEGGRLIETREGGKVFEVGRISVWEPGHRLVFGWRPAGFTPDQYTEVEVRFEPVGEETRVSVEHRGWDAIPATHVARHGFPEPIFLRREGQWWQEMLAGLRSRLEA